MQFCSLVRRVAAGRGGAKGNNPCTHEGEDKIARCNLSHEFIKGTRGSIRFALRGPEIAAFYLLPKCLVLVNPPVAYVLLLRRFSMCLLVEET